MILKTLPHELTVCKLHKTADIDLSKDFYFIGKTQDEISLVCKTDDTPSMTKEREDGWKGFYISGVLDFSLIGILSKINFPDTFCTVSNLLLTGIYCITIPYGINIWNSLCCFKS